MRRFACRCVAMTFEAKHARSGDEPKVRLCSLAYRKRVERNVYERGLSKIWAISAQVVSKEG